MGTTRSPSETSGTWLAGMPGFEPIGAALAVGKFLEAEKVWECGKGYSSSSPAKA